MARVIRWFKVTCKSGVGAVVKGLSVEAAVTRAAKILALLPGTQPKRLGKRGEREVWTVRRMLAGAPVREELEVEVFESYGPAWVSAASEGCEAVSEEKFRPKKQGGGK